ncbi:ATP-dependent DNA helicase [Trichonephila clavipes]|nr:ATP-dependent DNA helicase [Trichonephila clavipes]
MNRTQNLAHSGFQIKTNNWKFSNFGGLDIISIGDLRQLPPVRSTPIYKLRNQTIVSPILGRHLKFYELNEVMRQANQQFSSMLTKIGNGEQLDETKIILIESRFCTVEEAELRKTVWCAYGLVESFFKNDEGHNVTVNGDRYRAMITNFFIPELNNHDVQELWFQQDGATCHTARATIDLLKDTFGDRLISRFGPVNWPPRSCDLTPLDYFMWGYVIGLCG